MGKKIEDFKRVFLTYYKRKEIVIATEVEMKWEWNEILLGLSTSD